MVDDHGGRLLIYPHPNRDLKSRRAPQKVYNGADRLEIKQKSCRICDRIFFDFINYNKTVRFLPRVFLLFA